MEGNLGLAPVRGLRGGQPNLRCPPALRARGRAGNPPLNPQKPLRPFGGVFFFFWGGGVVVWFSCKVKKGPLFTNTHTHTHTHIWVCLVWSWSHFDTLAILGASTMCDRDSLPWVCLCVSLFVSWITGNRVWSSRKYAVNIVRVFFCHHAAVRHSLPGILVFRKPRMAGVESNNGLKRHGKLLCFFFSDVVPCWFQMEPMSSEHICMFYRA